MLRAHHKLRPSPLRRPCTGRPPRLVGRRRSHVLPRAARAWWYDLRWRLPTDPESTCPATDDERLQAAASRRPATFASVGFAALLAVLFSRRR